MNSSCDKDPRYPSQLRRYYSINSTLKADGILAPGNSSIESTLLLYKLINNPLDSIPTIHVGGTNGKGSTCYKLYNSLLSNNYKVGLFVSPHLASIRERIIVDNTYITEQSFVSYLDQIMSTAASNNINPTEFEVIFLISTLYFKEMDCDVVVLEVGLGGEYDATNVVNTALSIICSVSLDHTRILGPTVEAIATVKAGIAKPNKPILVGPGVPIKEVKTVADAKGAVFYSYNDCIDEFNHSLIRKDIEFCDNEGTNGVSSSPVVDVNALNTNIALLALLLLKKHYPGKFSNIATTDQPHSNTFQALLSLPPCRWECHTVILPEEESSVASPLQRSAGTTAGEGNEAEVVLDVGHNPAAVSALARKLRIEYSSRNIRIVYAMSRDKDVRTCLRKVAAIVPADRIHFVQSKNFRAVPKDVMNTIYREETGIDMVDIPGNNVSEVLTGVFKKVVKDIKQSPETQSGVPVVVICGTGYIMPEARAFIGINEPRDELDLQRN